MAVCFNLRNAGLTYISIQKVVHRSHCDIIHLIKRYKDLMSVNDPILLKIVSDINMPVKFNEINLDEILKNIPIIVKSGSKSKLILKPEDYTENYTEWRSVF